MTEQEWMEKIRLSAQDIEVPEGLSPESVKKKLDDMKAEEADKAFKGDKPGKEKSLKNSNQDQKKRKKNIVAAAAVMLVCGVGIFGMTKLKTGDGAAEINADMAASGGGTAAADGAGVSESASAAERKPADAVSAKKDAGDMYVVADGYSEVYDLLEKSIGDTKYNVSDLATGAAIEESADMKMDGGAADDIVYDMGADMSASDAGVTEINNSASKAESAKEDTAGYAKTNLQTEGVDESDIIKTDGSYIYVVTGDVVKIVDIQGGTMEEAGEINVALGSAADRVVEMYVNGDVLNLIIEREDTQLNENKKESSKTKNREKAQVYDVYYVSSDTVTELLTYDISNPRKPNLKGSVEQEGSYKTSRKIGDIVYLFTDKNMQMPELQRSEAIKGENAGGWIPVVAGEAVAADCIYIPEIGSSGLVVSSIDVGSPDKVVDNTLIINNYVNIYVSTNAMYLYHTDYSGSGDITKIAKFSLNKGLIDAVGATSAGGEVYDTFAINEYQGSLRLLTTDQSKSEQENQLYLFDENLKLTGSLKGIAKGEQIYAARYLGDTAYFVTYRNSDPLFAVDLSDKKKPKILSELKITGFSEYLHFWGQDKLFGIGYETDPDSGERKGIKLTMFDISDPADLKTAATCVLKNMDYSPALYDYKCVLADEGENLIGFAAESYDEDVKHSYLVFAWEDGKFRELLAESIGVESTSENCRGIYVGEKFYLANTDWIYSYDRSNGYKKLETLELY